MIAHLIPLRMEGEKGAKMPIFLPLSSNNLT